MRPSLAIGVICAALVWGGCAAAPRGAVIYGAPPLAAEQTPRANLALGPSAAQALAAEWLAGRSEWPVAEAGYRLGDVAYYFDYQNDDQSFTERGGASFYAYRGAYRSGVLVR